MKGSNRYIDVASHFMTHFFNM